MEFDVPSQVEFDRLHRRFDQLMTYLALEFYPCNHDEVTGKKEWERKYYCKDCGGSNEKIRKMP